MTMEEGGVVRVHRDHVRDNDDEEYYNDNSSKELDNNSGLDLWEECGLFFQIAVPTSSVQLFSLWLFPMTASFVGRKLGSEELAGFSLASLVGNMTCVSIIIGTLSGCETLQPRAMGMKQYNEVGLIAIRGMLVSVLMLVPFVIFLVSNLEHTLVYWGGQDEVASHLASRWINVYLLGLPSVLIFRTTQRFLACQNIVMPCVYAAAIGSFIIHPLILPYFVDQYGFMGSGLAISISQWSICLFTLLYLKWKQPHEPQTWPLFHNNDYNNNDDDACISIRISRRWTYIKQAIIPMKPLLTYTRLSLGGVLSLSEWWFWESICFLVGRMGLVPLCVHTIAYQIIPLCWMLPLGVSIGASVRIGTVLALNDVPMAQRLAKFSLSIAVLLGAFVSTILYRHQSTIVALFTNDPDVILGCQQIWTRVCIDVFILHIFCVQAGILRALGLQWTMATIIIITLWGITLPTILYYGQNDLQHIWTILPCGYSLLTLSLFGKIITVDWYQISNDIVTSRQKSTTSTSHTVVSLIMDTPTETTHLL